MIFFISDLHFGHNKEFIYKFRGFSSIEEHDETLIKNWNLKVGVQDTVYFIGDFSFSNNIENYISRLNGKIIIIEGNHDSNLAHYYSSKKYSSDFNKIFSYHTGFIDIKINGQPITLCHYPMRYWNKSHHGALHLYGHLHKKTDFGGKTLNVSVDNIGTYPISLDELVEYMKTRPCNEIKYEEIK